MSPRFQIATSGSERKQWNKEKGVLIGPRSLTKKIRVHDVLQKRKNAARKELWQRCLVGFGQRWAERLPSRFKGAFVPCTCMRTTVRRLLEDFVATWPVTVITLDFTLY